MKNQVTNGFDRMPIGDLMVKANFIISEMTANVAYFPAPTPALADVQAAADALQTATLAAQNGDRVAISNRNDKRDELVALLRRLGVYTNLMADSDRTIAMKSGFDLAKEPTPTPPITFVEAPSVSAGVNPGEIVAKAKRVDGIRSFQFLISQDDQLPVSKWEAFPTTESKRIFTGLESVKRYYVRVAAIGVGNQCVYSDASNFVTQ
jgi:hypothetical protein